MSSHLGSGESGTLLPTVLRILRTFEGDVTIIVLAGELDLSTAAILRSELERVAGTTRRIVLEMAGVVFLDSHGLGTIVGAQRTLRNDFCELVIRNPSPTVRHALDISGVASDLHVFDTGPNDGAGAIPLGVR